METVTMYVKGQPHNPNRIEVQDMAEVSAPMFREMAKEINLFEKIHHNPERHFYSLLCYRTITFLLN